MATKILIEKPAANELAKIYSARVLRAAELAAKRELITMSTAIDTAAAKGLYVLDYRISNSITRLQGDYYTAAMAIINEDIANAGYVVNTIVKNGIVTNLVLGWADPATSVEGYTLAENITGNPSELGLYELDALNQPRLTADTEVVEGKAYFVKNKAPVEPEPEPEVEIPAGYEVLTNPTGNPANYYEFVNGAMVKSQDSTFDENKTYYADVEYLLTEVSSESNPAELGLYEENNGAYVLTEDAAPVENKNYYKREIIVDSNAGATLSGYLIVSNDMLSNIQDPSAEDLYELVDGAYVKTSDRAVNNTKTYYMYNE